jgi:uncharacterized protein
MHWELKRFKMDRYAKAEQFILDKLKSGLPENLYYHGLHHVLDVLSSAEMLGEMENINGHDMELLRLAALFHDSGYVFSAKDHEIKGCNIARESLPGFGYSAEEIETICGMIMATRYPQKPHNLLEEIICDADLDYLGRDDFFEIGSTLFREMNNNGSITDEKDWNKHQEIFLSSHHYFTKAANDLRRVKKEQHLSKIREVLKEN